MHPSLVNIGAYIKANVLGLAPAAQAAGTRQGPAIDVTQYKSAVLAAVLGAATGAPTGISVKYRLESRIPAGAWTAVTDRDGVALEVEATAAASAVELDIDLTLIGDDHEEVRAVEVTAFTGGTAPTIVSGATLILAGARRLPI